MRAAALCVALLAAAAGGSTYNLSSTSADSWHLSVGLSGQARWQQLVVQGCAYAAPWETEVVSLSSPCVFYLPACWSVHGETSRVSVELESVAADDRLWQFRWLWPDGTDVLFSGQRVDSSLWVEYDGEYFALDSVPDTTFVQLDFVFSADSICVHHTLDAFGSLCVPWPPPTLLQSNAEDVPWGWCQLGPMPGVRVQLLEYASSAFNGTRRATGWNLLVHTRDPDACSVTLAELPVKSDRWTTLSPTEAVLHLAPRDFVRCLTDPVAAVDLASVTASSLDIHTL